MQKEIERHLIFYASSFCPFQTTSTLIALLPCRPRHPPKKVLKGGCQRDHVSTDLAYEKESTDVHG